MTLIHLQHWNECKPRESISLWCTNHSCQWDRITICDSWAPPHSDRHFPFTDRSIRPANGDCLSSCMLLTRSRTRQVPGNSPIYHIRSINKSLLMRLLFVNSCSNVLPMLRTLFIYCLWRWIRSTGRCSQWTRVDGRSRLSVYIRFDPAFRNKGSTCSSCRKVLLQTIHQDIIGKQWSGLGLHYVTIQTDVR